MIMRGQDNSRVDVAARRSSRSTFLTLQIKSRSSTRDTYEDLLDYHSAWLSIADFRFCLPRACLPTVSRALPRSSGPCRLTPPGSIRLISPDATWLVVPAGRASGQAGALGWTAAVGGGRPGWAEPASVAAATALGGRRGTSDRWSANDSIARRSICLSVVIVADAVAAAAVVLASAAVAVAACFHGVVVASSTSRALHAPWLRLHSRYLCVQQQQQHHCSAESHSAAWSPTPSSNTHCVLGIFVTVVFDSQQTSAAYMLSV